MRGARAFLHISKMFGERERELRTRRWRGGCLTNLLDRSTRCHLRLRRRRAPRPRTRELGTARASACVDGEALRHVGQPNVTASPRLAALARLKYHLIIQTPSCRVNEEPTQRGPVTAARRDLTHFELKTRFIMTVYFHISYQGRLRLQTSPGDYAVSRARLTNTHNR